MKKKLLSLVLAGAMVASTSVSAFAADTAVPTKETTTTIESNEDEKDIQIGVTGNILNDAGNTVPGTISVTVPTATTFSVDASTGELSSPKMKITNNGEEGIKVIASKFEDSNGTEKINIVKKSEFEKKPIAENERGTVWLRLTGASKNLGLTSESNGSENGRMYDNNYNTEQTAGTDYEIGKIAKGEVMNLWLEGKGGTQVSPTKPSTDAIQDNFTLVLKIARDR